MCHRTAKKVIPLVHPAYVLSPLEEKLKVLTVSTKWGVTQIFDLCKVRGAGLRRQRRMRPRASVVLPLISISKYTGGVLKAGEIPHPKQAWRILFFATVIFASLSLPPLDARAWAIAIVKAMRLALFAAATAI
jgi:hypothetical protein